MQKLTAMQVNDDFKTGSTSPADCIVEVFELTVDIWITIQVFHGPISNRNSDMVHTRTGDLIQVVGSDESAPVLVKHRAACV
jgi:hypothetical protein